MTKKEVKRIIKFITEEMRKGNMIAGLHGEERAHDPILVYRLAKCLIEA